LPSTKEAFFSKPTKSLSGRDRNLSSFEESCADVVSLLSKNRKSRKYSLRRLIAVV
jgi:hypothetical protein